MYKPLGAPTEVSLLTLGQKAGLQQKQLQDSKPRVGAIPFESEHKVGRLGNCIDVRQDYTAQPPLRELCEGLLTGTPS